MTQSSPLDPITLAVVKSALDAIVDEMAYTVIRTARSEIVKDVMDYSTALSRKFALSEHGVAIDPATLTVDAEATRAARRTRA